MGMQPHPLAKFFETKLIRFGQVWESLGKFGQKWLRFGQIWIGLGKINNLHPQKYSISKNGYACTCKTYWKSEFNRLFSRGLIQDQPIYNVDDAFSVGKILKSKFYYETGPQLENITWGGKNILRGKGAKIY